MSHSNEKKCFHLRKQSLGRRCLWVFLVLGLLNLAHSSPANAGFVVFTDAKGVEWEANFADTIDLQFVAHVPGAGNRNTVGKLIDKTVRKSLDPFTIHFIQRTEAPDEQQANDGLRILFESEVKNQTGKAWNAYRMQLIDDSFPSPFNKDVQDNNHPIEAHFHTLNGATYDPFTKFDARKSSGKNGGAPDPVAADVSLNLFITDGQNVVAKNGQLTVRNLLLHEREFSPTQMGELSDPGRRFFDLILTPYAVPEPSTFVLAASGLLILGGWRYRRTMDTPSGLQKCDP